MNQKNRFSFDKLLFHCVYLWPQCDCSTKTKFIENNAKWQDNSVCFGGQCVWCVVVAVAYFLAVRVLPSHRLNARHLHDFTIRLEILLLTVSYKPNEKKAMLHCYIYTTTHAINPYAFEDNKNYLTSAENSNRCINIHLHKMKWINYLRQIHG